MYVAYSYMGGVKKKNRFTWEVKMITREEQFECVRIHTDDKYCIEICLFNTGEIKAFLFSELPWTPRLCVVNYMRVKDKFDDKTKEDIISRALRCTKAYEELVDTIDVPYNTI